MKTIKGPNGLVVEVPEHVASGLVASGMAEYAERPAGNRSAQEATKPTRRKTPST